VKAIVGTAGHIDHGKSALVKALTGVETDRLPEEQQRGISIELGFAWMEHPSGGRVGLVDVPGHERFIRQMLAGAQGFDLVLMTVAADDGVMPQTEEHFDIVHLLGARAMIFVITKCDLADAARIADVREEIQILAADTPFENSVVQEVSARSGAGIEELRAVLFTGLEQLERPDRPGVFRMPIDRSFVLKGHGTVVTGTAAGGSLAPGDEIVVLPGRAGGRVREIQVHGEKVDRVWAGQRVALNLSGVDRSQAGRGDTVATPGVEIETDRFDALVELRPSARNPVASHERVRIYVGTDELAGRVLWLDGVESLEPRGRAWAQLVLSRPAIVLAGDRFVIRDQTAARTLGGGSVVLPRAPRHRPRESGVGQRLYTMMNGSPLERALAYLDAVSSLGASPAELAIFLGVEPTELVAMTGESLVMLPDSKKAQLVVSTAGLEAFRDGLVESVGGWLSDNKDAGGLELEQLRRESGGGVGGDTLDAKIFRVIVDEMVAGGILERAGSRVLLPGHRAELDEGDQALADRLCGLLAEAGCTPPFAGDLADSLGTERRRLAGIARVLEERGLVVRVSPDFIVDAAVATGLEQQLKDFLADNEKITAAGFRDLIGASRKYSIPLLDYFDHSGVTIRSGDYRLLREQ